MTRQGLTKRQQFWLKHVRAAMGSSAPMQGYAKRHGLSAAALYNAKSVFKRMGLLKSASRELAPSAFVPVQMAPQVPPLVCCRLQHVSGWQLEMERLPDARWIRGLMGSDPDVAA
jgi:hypothetical protein